MTPIKLTQFTYVIKFFLITKLLESNKISYCFIISYKQYKIT